MKKLNMLNKSCYGTLLIALLAVVSFACDSADINSSEFATVSGTITFKNVASWPDSGEVQVTVFPENVWTQFGAMGPPQNPNDPVILTKTANTEYAFTIEGLPGGNYSALAVGWRRPNAQNYPAEKRTATLGVYWLNSDSVSVGLNIPGSPFNDPAPAVIAVTKGQVVKDLNFAADFAYVRFLF